MCDTSVTTPVAASAAAMRATTRSARGSQSARGATTTSAARSGRRGPGAAREVGGIRLEPLRPQGVDGAHEVVGRAGVVEDDVGDGAALRVGGLGGDAVAGVLLGEAALLDEPAHPGLDVGLDDDGEVLVHPEAALDEERHVVDRDTVTRSGGPLLGNPGRRSRAR